MKKIFILLFAAPFILSSCEKTITLDLDEQENLTNKIVIEGLLTDDAAYNYVKVSRTTGFYSSGSSPRITNATVSIEDGEGNIVNFLHYTGENADSLGYYLPETEFAGVVGKTYTLTVVADGETFTATDKLARLVPIEKLDYRINDDEFEDPEDPGRFYELLLYVTEPKETKDYYLFKSVRNGKVEYMSETDIYFSDDELIAEKIEGIPLPVFFAQNDVAGVEVYSLSREAFIFYRDLQKLLNNDGGLFGTPPANPRTNLSNGAVGFFQVSSLKKGELVIE
jgi:hypothetical protein